ncbi:nitrite reductase large subunit NirB [Solemya velum gill symbiont]|uniref:nitrite reductase large subunit NirB n=1 Tax=Solemya velum gill symbiont TaxID=2340 RepID=UPI0009985116|nr:nitrite reductase large subunit NirB [Solemya velum gill symbiont]OOZ45022.1 nitrite reductase large subunit [Solemya velum gill symbiont]OOZ50441.1 nitrite reductase large subunit [Solemya velum gill symbiont]OOZ53340.1 nitrite reductase large subunit [Solemya velum gill symbiont]OOZ58762.1 nitrite reductase large subunit [Solemya velum gill symbiont]OOZ68240.1 nitrite reductase large subunit [Solemya velum gill symbiont]
MKENLVLIGNGMAGMRTIEELLKLAPEKYNITVFGEEPYGNYNRIMLSPVLANEKTIDEIMLNDEQWYKDNGIGLLKGIEATEIDRVNRDVVGSDGTRVPYDRLIIATGSTPFMLPLPGADKYGVIGFRDIADVDTMVEASQQFKKAVVIGGGLLGLEAANGLMKQGMDVTVVHLMDSLMERQLDKPAAAMLKKSLEERGMNFLLEHVTDEILGEERVTGLRFKNGEEIDTDLVVMAVGIKPNFTLAQESGLHCERGIVVNDTMQTFDPNIYAVGECVQHRGTTYGLVAPLFEQAKVAANHLAEYGIGRYEGTVTSTKLKVTGIDLFSAGDFTGDETTDELVFQDKATGTYKKLIVKDNRILGSVLYGDTVDGTWYFQLMKEGTDISAFRNTILFGQAHLGDSGHGEETRVAAMPDDAEICGCNGVCKGNIVKAITDDKLFTLDDVRSHTKASASCGSCTGLVESLLAHTVGGDYEDAPSKKPMCGCTSHTHEEVRKGIFEQELKTMDAVRSYFGWTTPDGCPACRNALNYYLLSSWPIDYQDDPQSRFINERAHGNIQKDGTYSVVPRMFGGLCTPSDLRTIADVADKYEVPEMKVTGGQRIDMFGVKKENLPDMWKDLTDAGFVSGHAYGKAMRTVKTCVGDTWCRFGTQNSTGLGVKLEELTWGSWMPHKFKLAVSGCPRNCAEATIKDFGVVCVDSGYELHIGGNGGIKVRVTDLLCKVETEEEVLEYCGAFCQLYREDAHYLERTAPWVERVGLAKVKEAVVDDAEQRKALYERFKISQVEPQKDPWKNVADGNNTEEFTPIKLAG